MNERTNKRNKDNNVINNWSHWQYAWHERRYTVSRNQYGMIVLLNMNNVI